MTIKVQADETHVIWEIDAHADQCPLCHHKVIAKALYIKERLSTDGALLEIIYECPNQDCDELFIGYFAGLAVPGPIRLYRTRPFTPVPIILPQPIQDISPAFCVIYGEAHQAEELGLTQICGVGYRKALEFLIKDYLIDLRPDDEFGINTKMLGPVIEKYIDDPRIKEIAKRATWLGNDETHYQRRWIDKDLSDLKRLIGLVLHWIEVEHLTNEALASMPEKK
jgi:hypothetical protein